MALIANGFVTCLTCQGEVGSGKSSLVSALLGDVTKVRFDSFSLLSLLSLLSFFS
jgi:hypothetical protein